MFMESQVMLATAILPEVGTTITVCADHLKRQGTFN